MWLMDATITAGVKITSMSRWCRENGVSRRTFYRHKERIEAEGSWQPRSRRPKASPGRDPGAGGGRDHPAGGRSWPPVTGQTRSSPRSARPPAGQDRAARGWRVPHRSTVNKILRSGPAWSRTEPQQAAEVLVPPVRLRPAPGLLPGRRDRGQARRRAGGGGLRRAR